MQGTHTMLEFSGRTCAIWNI